MDKIFAFLRNHRIISNLLIMFVILVILFISLNVWLRSYTRHDDLTLLPSVKYLTIEEAADIFKRHNLKYEIIDSVFNDRATPGMIVEQVPAADTKVKEERTIYLTINAYSPKSAKIPTIINTSIRQAEAQLKSVGFKNIEIMLKPSPYKDLVLDVKHDGKSIAENEKIPTSSRITLIVGEGEQAAENDSVNEIDNEEFLLGIE
ncbi:MAG: PASTA domain-containing protein [Bacteroidaceae bacterium]|nr:PASTA domain-containing protein [Bacteroidaceae bacterium]